MTAKQSLTENQIQRIRADKLKKGKDFNAAGWARQLGVDRSTVSRAARGKSHAGDDDGDGGGVATLPWRSIEPGDNPRAAFDQERLQELASSIAELGVLEPLSVFRDQEARSGEAATGNEGHGKHRIIFGQRRFHAIGLLVAKGKLKQDYPVPVIVRDVKPREALLMALAENLGHEDMHPLDEGNAFHELAILDMKPSAIAAKIGRSPRHVQARIRLVKRLSTTAVDAFRNGKITLAQAEALADTDADGQAAVLAEPDKYPTEADVRAKLRPAGDPPAGRRSSPAKKKVVTEQDLLDAVRSHTGGDQASTRPTSGANKQAKQTDIEDIVGADAKSDDIHHMVKNNPKAPRVHEFVSRPETNDHHKGYGHGLILAVRVYDPERDEHWWFNRGAAGEQR